MRRKDTTVLRQARTRQNESARIVRRLDQLGSANLQLGYGPDRDHAVGSVGSFLNRGSARQPPETDIILY